MTDLWRLRNILTDTERVIAAKGPTAVNLAPQLEARGWPSGTLGTGARSSDPTTSVERDTILRDEHPDTKRWDGITALLDLQLRELEKAARLVQITIAQVTAHASDQDRPNRSVCVACGKSVDGYLRRGLCNPCNLRLRRSGVERDVWLAQLRTDRSTLPAQPGEHP